MELRKITEADLAGRGVVGMADTPNLSARQMQEKVEEVVRSVVIPVMNENAEKTVTKQNLADAIFNSGAGDMHSSYYDKNSDGIVDLSDNGLFVYKHLDNNLSGSGANGKFKATSTATKTSFVLNGKSYSVRQGTENSIELNANCWYTFILDDANNTINFNNGGGLTNSKLSLATARAEDVANGKTFYAGNKELKKGTSRLRIAKGEFQSIYNGTSNIDTNGKPKFVVICYRYSGAADSSQVIFYDVNNPNSRYRIHQSYFAYEEENKPGDIYGYLTFTDNGFDFWGYYSASGNQKILYWCIY